MGWASISFFIICPPSSLNGTQPKLATCLEVSVIWKCMFETWIIPSTQMLAQNHLFLRWLRNLTTLTADISERNKMYTIGQVCWKLQGVSHIISKVCEHWSTNVLKFDRRFYPHSINTAFYFIGRLRKQKPTKLCQTVDCKLR